MLTIAEARSIDPILQQIVQGVAEAFDAELARIWLKQTDSECPVCSPRVGLSTPVTALHLRGSTGISSKRPDRYANLEGHFHKIQIGHRKIGQIAARGKPMLIPHVTGEEAWIADREWVRTSPVRSFAGQPLVFKGEVLGVLAVFSHASLNDEDFRWLRTFADYAAVALANAKAFEELEDLREQLMAENEYLNEEIRHAHFGEIIGKSAALNKVLEQVSLVADTHATVLILGESGTGKEMIARAIHDKSSRRSRPFIKVNCGAIPGELFESEFFGHVKGAFTGAIKDRIGRFELAHSGDIFLDEIAEIPLPLQAKLLRVLQEKEIERIGESKTRKVDVRVIGATNRNLKRQVEEGRFREDLYFRLSVFPIELPPLRHRKEDVPGLAAHFLEKSAAKLGMTAPRLTEENVRDLERYDWPGNIRELENVMERATILSRNNGRLIFDLHGSIQFPQKTARVAKQVDAEQPGLILTRNQLRERELQNILAALKQSDGKIFGAGGAAEILGMKPTTLASRVKALGFKKKFVGPGSNP